MNALVAAVYAAREGRPAGPPARRPADLPTQPANLLAELRAACEGHQDHAHAKTCALAVELLNDWEAIFQVLNHPELPLTNAERALAALGDLAQAELGHP